MTDFVLVHGAWHGAWCWRALTDTLLDRGHRVWAPSLSGLADRAHLLSSQITLSTHVQDVLRLIEFESLEGCVLVGHSYGGNIVTAVADRLRERLAHCVYLDAVVPPDEAHTWRWADQHSESVREARLEMIRNQGEGRLLPAPPAQSFGLSDPRQIAWVGARLTPMPAGTYTGLIALDHGGSAGLPRTYVAAIDPVYEPLRPVHDRLRHDPGWHFLEMRTGHDLMVTEPLALAEVLIGCAQR